MKIKVTPTKPREYHFRLPPENQSKRVRAQHRRSRQSPQQRHAQSIGLRIGYWPCLGGPFVAIDLGSHRWDIWYGRVSYQPGATR